MPVAYCYSVGGDATFPLKATSTQDNSWELVSGTFVIAKGLLDGIIIFNYDTFSRKY